MTELGKGYGQTMECPSSGVVRAVCASGKNLDCWRNDVGYINSAVDCVPLSDEIFKASAPTYPKSGGTIADCGDDALVVGACFSGKSNDCPGGVHTGVTCRQLVSNAWETPPTWKNSTLPPIWTDTRMWPNGPVGRAGSGPNVAICSEGYASAVCNGGADVGDCYSNPQISSENSAVGFSYVKCGTLKQTEKKFKEVMSSGFVASE